MADHLFVKIWMFILIIVLIGYSSPSPSLLSRFRNRQEYVPNADLEMIKSLDDKTYEDLMNEIPILRQVFRGNRRQNSYQSNASALPYLYKKSGAERVRQDTERRARPASAVTARAASPASSGRAAPPPPPPPLRHAAGHWHGHGHAHAHGHGPVAGMQRTRGAEEGPRARAGDDSGDWHLHYPYVISCYWCGLNDTLLPVSTLCHDAFTSREVGMISAARFFRAQCYFYSELPTVQQRAAPTYPPQEAARAQLRDPALKMRVFGPYTRGCFKRFVDVGPLYTARGCRGAYLPQRAYSRTFASHRLMRLEVVARGHDDVCVHSPYASLTPFSRALSLYVRYHVCVCSRPYCNAAPRPSRALLAAAAAAAAAATAAATATAVLTGRTPA